MGRVRQKCLAKGFQEKDMVDFVNGGANHDSGYCACDLCSGSCF